MLVFARIPGPGLLLVCNKLAQETRQLLALSAPSQRLQQSPDFITLDIPGIAGIALAHDI
ncbi:MAG: hypothetical protein NVS2B12_32970 [Ktedonobacteraceae bacterium]